MDWLIWLIIILVVIGMFGSNAEKKQKLEMEQEALRRRTDAENYILNSGDPEAIKMLMLARANPANYSQVLAGGMNRGNDTLKTALGVMTGVVAGNMISNAITASAITSAMEDMQTNLDATDHSSFSDASSSGADSFGCMGDDISIDI